MTRTITIDLVRDEPHGSLTDGETTISVRNWRRSSARSVQFEVECDQEWDAFLRQLLARVRA